MRVALYCRVSTDEQTQGRTIESQIKELESLAQARGYVVAEKYIDDGWSGALLSRPALDALRDDAGKHLFEGVLINDVDRLSRDIANLAVVKRDLEAKGVDVIFKNLPSDRSPLSNFMVNILGSFAEFERAMIADRTRRGRRFKVQERKLIMGNIPPYGYRYVKKDRQRSTEGHYEVDPEEARVVTMMFSWVAEGGLSSRAVLRRLRELGISPRHGRNWSWSSVHRVLANETYAGTTYYNKHEVTDSSRPPPANAYVRHKTGRRLRDRTEWIAIPLPEELRLVPTETFERVQVQLQRNRAFSPRNAKYFYLLRLVRRVCGRCGSAFVGTPYHGRRFYRCCNRDSLSSSSAKCRAAIVSAAKMEDAVWNAVSAAVQNPELILEQVKKRRSRRLAEHANTQEEVARLQHGLAVLEQEEERILIAYRKGVTTLLQFEKEMAQVNLRHTALRDALAKAAREVPLPPPESALRDLKRWASVVRGKLESFNDVDKAGFLGCLLNEIIIDAGVLRIRGEIKMTGSNIVPTQGHPASNSAISETELASAIPREKDPARRSIVPTPINGYGHNPTNNIVPNPIDGYGHNTTYEFDLSVVLPTAHMRRVSGARYGHSATSRDSIDNSDL